MSKGTIINIVKGYPYNPTEKQGRYHKLEEQSAANLEAQIKRAESEAKQTYKKGNYTAYGSHLQRWLTLLQTYNKGAIYENIQSTRTQYEQKAWEAFAESNYSLFGYYADTWEVLTDILGDNAKNPWRVIALKINAKGHSHSVKYSKIKGLGDLCRMRHNCDYTEISDESWKLIQPAMPRNKSAGRPYANNRQYFNGIMFALCHCRSLRSVPKEYGDPRKLQRVFAAWYRAGVFGDLLELAPACPELEGIRGELLTIVMHNLVHGSQVVPRLCDIKRVVDKHEEERPPKGTKEDEMSRVP